MAIIQAYKGPWGGLNVGGPDIIIPPTDSPSMDNVILRQNYLTSRPPFLPDILPQLDEKCLAIVSVFSNSGHYTTYAYSNTSAYRLQTNAAGWDGPFALPAPGIYSPNYVQALGNVYFVNGNEYVMYNTGSIATNLYGARFIFELAQSLLIADTFEGAQEFPQRVRWCEAGNLTHWDPGTYIGAGFNDLIDVADRITGTLSLGSVGYILRKNGITQVTPTGNGINPFYFNHLWASEHGIGNYFPQTVCAYGSVGFIVSSENVYTFTLSSFDSIGDKIIEELMKDIFKQSLDPVFYSWVLPRRYDNTNGALYNCYEIGIPYSDGMVIWSFSLKDKNWMRHTIPGIVFSAPANMISYKVTV